MKNYVRPSIELNRFDAEDIIRTSGEVTTGYKNLSENTQNVVDAYNANAAAANKISDSEYAVEFVW